MNYTIYALGIILCVCWLGFGVPFLVSQANTILVISGFISAFAAGIAIGIMLYDIVEDIFARWQ